MRFLMESPFRDYLHVGDANTKDNLADNIKFIEAIDALDVLVRKDIWSDTSDLNPMQALLCANCVMMLCSGIRMALTGHMAATFPLHRAALESACYAFLISRNPKLADVWANRHKSSAALVECRRAFSGAVAIAAKKLSADTGEKGHEQWINECYQNAIDHGAHPNPHSVLRHISEPVDIGDEIQIQLSGLYGYGSSGMTRCLMAALDFGAVVAVVLAASQKNATDYTYEKFNGFMAIKDALAFENFTEAHPPVQ